MNAPECKLPIELLEHKLLHPEIIELHISYPEGFTWKAGDYLWLTHENAVAKPFSIASLPNEAKIRLQIAHLENIKDWLASFITTKSGFISTAISQFHWPEPTGSIVCFAGGTGITPIISLLQTHLTTSNDPVNLYWGVRNHTLAYLKSDLDKLQQSHAHFSYQIILSAEDGYDTKQTQHGLIPDLLTDGHIQLPDQAAHILICGPWAMVKALESVLPADKIKTLQH